jgi:VIT1/CCC1 family predicted Fe2+/Mn2+ transporter
VAACSSFALFVAGALVPVVPFALGLDGASVAVALIASGLALLCLGGWIGRLTGHGVARSAVRQLLIGLAAAGVTYGIGALIGVSVA